MLAPPRLEEARLQLRGHPIEATATSSCLQDAEGVLERTKLVLGIVGLRHHLPEPGCTLSKKSMTGTALRVAGQGSICRSTPRHVVRRARTAVGKPQRCGAAHTATTWRAPQQANGCRRGTRARAAQGDDDDRATDLDTAALTKPSDDAGAALRELAAAFAALPPSFLERISADQYRDLRDLVRKPSRVPSSRVLAAHALTNPGARPRCGGTVLRAEDGGAWAGGGPRHGYAAHGAG